MLTGKIYKNKLSNPQQQIQPSQFNTNSQLRTLNRVKSQPGIAQIPAYKQHMQNILQGTVRNQRDKILQQLHQTSQANTFIKTLIEQPEDQHQNLGASDHVLEYQRKMKDHIQKIQSRYEIKFSHMQSVLQAKNQTIAQLKSALRQKQKIIQKMAQENKALATSRQNTSRVQ